MGNVSMVIVLDMSNISTFFFGDISLFLSSSHRERSILSKSFSIERESYCQPSPFWSMWLKPQSRRYYGSKIDLPFFNGRRTCITSRPQADPWDEVRLILILRNTLLTFYYLVFLFNRVTMDSLAKSFELIGDDVSSF